MSGCNEVNTDNNYTSIPDSSASISTNSTATSSQDTTTEINNSSEERSGDNESTIDSTPNHSSKTKASSKPSSSTVTSAESSELSSTVSSAESEVIDEIISYATQKDASVIADKILEYINDYRIKERKTAAVKLTGLTEYAKYRSRQLIANFAHDTKDERAAATALQYGQYIDPALFGMTGEPYYTANCGEAIAKTDFGGTVEAVAQKFAKLTRSSSDHWSYVGSEQYRYIAVGVTYESGVWYCCIAVTINNSDKQ